MTRTLRGPGAALWPAAALLLAACGTEQASEAPQPATVVEAPQPAPIVAELAVTGGMVRGVVAEHGLKQYHGIPYAAAPIGERRWAAPQPVQPWTDVRDASQPGPACMQPEGVGGALYGQTGFAMSEDCLTLNVWTRATHVGEGLPVMVWIHGGGLTTGTGSLYPGEQLTAKGVVLVTINYRLGPFGFLAHPALSLEEHGVSGNQGLRDQIAALHWVRDNITAFGGDAGNVTIFGESAGSRSTSLLQASPLARGLFHRVIGQSGSAFKPMWLRDQATSYAASAETIGMRFVLALAGENLDPKFSDLRTVSAQRILETFQSHPDFSNTESLAIVDGEVIPEEVAAIFAAGKQADVPVLIGVNSDEGSAFVPMLAPLFGKGAAGFGAYVQAALPEAAGQVAELYPAGNEQEAERSWSDFFGDVTFGYPIRAWARGMENVTSDAYLYWFTWWPPVADREQLRAFHAAEIGYVFGNLGLFNAAPADEDRDLSDLMARIWVQFAKTGNPNGHGLPEWPAYTRGNEAYMEIGKDTGAKSGLRMAQMALVERAWSERRGFN